jgi:sulfite exporter TauE/SafE
MTNSLLILLTTAATIGFIHTITGPDHYLPFIVISKARKWSLAKTSLITFLCGVGHVLSSVILGFLGLIIGLAVFKLESIESYRGDVAAWLLLGFGFAYFIWGIRWAVLFKPHRHFHFHEEGNKHNHLHRHSEEHIHIHESNREAVNITPWILFIIFVFGPCEPLIPLIMYPAAQHNMGAVTLVAAVFSLTTISTMMIIVMTSSYGLAKLPLGKMERYSHALAGLAILLCGVAIKFLGL